MTHSYNVEIALAVGGVPEAVVLKEIAYWCKKNEEIDKHRHDGRFWTYKSIAQWKEEFPEFKGNISHILQRLESGGWLVSGNYNKTSFDRTKWYTITEKSISLFAQIDLTEMQNGFADSDEPIPSGKTSGKTTEEILKKNAEVIDRLYAIYPGKSETRDGMRSTGKCSKDKHRLAILLRTHTPEQIERTIRNYIEEQGGKYLKNFSTFLNNFPEDEGGDTALPPQSGSRGTGQDW